MSTVGRATHECAGKELRTYTFFFLEREREIENIPVITLIFLRGNSILDLNYWRVFEMEVYSSETPEIVYVKPPCVRNLSIVHERFLHRRLVSNITIPTPLIQV